MQGLKKHRGLRRFYKNLAVKNDLDKIDWQDFDKQKGYWHLHFDKCGYGDYSFKSRKPHLDKLFRHFNMLVEKTSNLNNQFQLYTILLDYHSGSDALFMHPPNSDNSQFMFQISDLRLTSTLTNKPLDDYINQLEGYEKRYGQASEAFCLIFKKGVGQPFVDK